MDLLNKVKSELEKKGYDFSSEFWADRLKELIFGTPFTNITKKAQTFLNYLPQQLTLNK